MIFAWAKTLSIVKWKYSLIYLISVLLVLVKRLKIIGDYKDHASISPVDMSGTRNLIQLSLTLGKKGSCYINNIKSRSRAFNLPQSSNNHKAELELMLTFF